MKITKFVHACLLVETPDRVAIFDPGEFSWSSGLFDVNTLERLDDIVITHEHFDHFDVGFVKALVEKFPKVTITAVPLVCDKLSEIGIANAQSTASEGVEIEQVAHESMAPLAPPPNPNFVVHYLRRLTHPGDSHHFTGTKEILALPINAPWGTWRRAAELGLELKPKTIIPIHDWHLNSEARAGAYDRFEAFFKEHDITFIKVVDGQPIEL